MNRKPFRASDGPTLMLIAFGIMLAMQFVISFFIMGAQWVDNSGFVEELLNYIGMLLLQGTYLAVFLIYCKKRKIACDYNPLKKLTPWSAIAAPLLAVVCLFSFMGLSTLFDFLLEKIGFSLDAVSGMLDTSSPVSIVLLVIDTCLAAPICEELIFRVGLLSGMNKVCDNALKMSLVSGVCFALMHINPAQTVYQFCLGAVIAYVVIKTGSALPGMIMHATSNVLAIVFSYTEAGSAVDGFYMQVGGNVLIMLLCCVVLPALAVVIVWLAVKFLHRVEQNKYPEKFVRRKVIWIDETTKEPIFEGGEAPVITEENRYVQKGFSPMTGAPVIVDRLELQNSLLDDYHNKGEKAGLLGKNSYKVAFIVYFAATAAMWLLMLGSGMLLGAYEGVI